MSGVKVTRIGSAAPLTGGNTLDASYSGDDVDVVTGLPIDGLLDVTAPTPTDGDGIVWRDAEDAWVNEHALTEGDVIALITPDIYACTSLTVIGGRGSIAAGAHTDLHAVGGTTVEITESTGAIGFNVEAAFAGVDAITDVYVHGYYTGNHADTEVGIYNYDTTAWDTLITFNVGESTMTLYHQSIADGSPYFDGGGNAKIRFYHPSNGNASHRLYLDYIAISHATGTTGGLALDDITDVNAPAPDDGDVLTWDATPGEWVPVAPGAASVSEIADLPTAETDTALVLHPDGAGGIAWGTDATGGGGGGRPSAYGNAVVALRPIAYYPLQEASGIFCEDASGSERHGSYHNAGVTYHAAGPVTTEAYAVTLNGSSGFISLPIWMRGRSALGWSIVAWFKTSANGRNEIFNGRGVVTLPTLTVGPTATASANGKVSYWVDAGGTDFGHNVQTTTYNDNNWHMVVGAADGRWGANQAQADYDIYMDGTIAAAYDNHSTGTPTYPFPAASDTSRGIIGAQENAGAGFFNGSLAHVAFFARKLTSSEVTALWNARDD